MQLSRDTAYMMGIHFQQSHRKGGRIFTSHLWKCLGLLFSNNRHKYDSSFQPQ